MKNLIITFALVCLCPLAYSQQVLATFDNLDLHGTDTFWNGADESGKFVASGYTFPNSYNSAWKSWSGWSYSNMTDSSTAGFGNQYSCYDVSGVNGTSAFAVCSGSPWIILPRRMTITGTYVTNAAFAAQSMLKGDQFAKKFGGADGNEKDWFLLKAFGYADGKVKDSTELYLADFRDEDNSKDYILNRWTWLSLKELGDIDSLQFRLSSTDVGQHGMNTPAAFCLDDFNGLAPKGADVSARFDEFNFAKDTFYNGSDLSGGFVSGGFFFPNRFNAQWSSWSGWAASNMTDTADKTIANQYSSFRSGLYGGNHAIGFGSPTIRLGYGKNSYATTPELSRLVFINNTVFGYHAIKNGTQFSKKFGGPSGNDPDYLILNIYSVDYDGNSSDTIDIVLADYRFEDNNKDFILDDWNAIFLEPLMNDREVVRLEFYFESSDTGQFGINTPQYFAMANFNYLLAGIEHLDIEPLQLYPNPARDFISIKNFEGDKLEVYNMMGQEVSVERTGNDLHIQSLKSGPYFIKAVDGDRAYIGKFIKQ